MNKKTIIIGVLVGVAIIGGGIYIYNKNKKANDTGMTTEKDALEFANKLKNKKSERAEVGSSNENLGIPTDKMSKFIEQYTKNIDKKTHKGIISAFDKKRDEITSQDKLYESTLSEKVFKPLGIK